MGEDKLRDSGLTVQLGNIVPRLLPSESCNETNWKIVRENLDKVKEELNDVDTTDNKMKYGALQSCNEDSFPNPQLVTQHQSPVDAPLLDVPRRKSLKSLFPWKRSNTTTHHKEHLARNQFASSTPPLTRASRKRSNRGRMTRALSMPHNVFTHLGSDTFRIDEDSNSEEDGRPRGISEPSSSSSSMKHFPPTRVSQEILQLILVDECKKVRRMVKRHCGDLNETLGTDEGGLLHNAAYKGCVRCMKTLLKHGCYVNLSDGQGWTPLHAAVLGRDVDAVRFLLANSALPNVLSLVGLSPCHLSVFVNDVAIMHELVQAGGDALQTATMHAQYTPFQLALDLKRTLLVDYLLRLPCFLVGSKGKILLADS